MSTEQAELLIKEAETVARQSYAPYSNFPVGAAVMSKSGRLHMGANIENASYGLTVCAERVALMNAMMAGNAAKQDITALAVWAAKPTNHAVTPCGACRQVMVELMHPNAAVVHFCSEKPGELKIVPVKDLLPGAFSLSS